MAQLVEVVGRLFVGAIQGQWRGAELWEAAGWKTAPVLSAMVAELDRQIEAIVAGTDAEMGTAVQKHRERIVAGLPDDLVDKVRAYREAEGARELERQAAERTEREMQRRVEALAEALAKAPTPLRPPDPLRKPEA
jgi:hypothetical protein